MRIVRFTPFLGGYTLLELVVVLSLMAGITAMALPNLNRLYQSVTRNMELKKINNQISVLSYRAYQQRKAMRITSPADVENAEIELPADWRVEILNPITISSMGFCSGGILLFEKLEARYTYEYPAPHCRSPSIVSPP